MKLLFCKDKIKFVLVLKSEVQQVDKINSEFAMSTKLWLRNKTEALKIQIIIKNHECPLQDVLPHILPQI